MKTKITSEEEMALHGLIEQAFKLAADIRMASAGTMTLAAVANAHVPAHVKDKAGFLGGTEWMGAHDYAHQLATVGVGDTGDGGES